MQIIYTKEPLSRLSLFNKLRQKPQMKCRPCIVNKPFSLPSFSLFWGWRVSEGVLQKPQFKRWNLKGWSWSYSFSSPLHHILHSILSAGWLNMWGSLAIVEGLPWVGHGLLGRHGLQDSSASVTYQGLELSHPATIIGIALLRAEFWSPIGKQGLASLANMQLELLEQKLPIPAFKQLWNYTYRTYRYI